MSTDSHGGPEAPSVPLVRVATAPADHASELREALGAAGIEALVHDVVPMTQVQAVRLQQRPMADVLVEASRESEARAIVDRLQAEGETAAEEQADQPGGAADSSTAGNAHAEHEGARRPLLFAAFIGFVGLAFASMLLFGFDRLNAWASNRFPYAFPIAALALLGGVYLALRRKD